MIWLIVAAVSLAAVVLWMLIETRGTLHLLWVIPLCIGLLTATHQWATAMFGYPTEEYEVGQKFSLISYYVPNEEDKIVVWVVLENEKIPKSIVIPYDPKEEEGLQEVANKMANGAKFEGVFAALPEMAERGNEGSQTYGGKGTPKSTGGELSFKELTVEHFLPPKDYIKEESPEILQ